MHARYRGERLPKHAELGPHQQRSSPEGVTALTVGLGTAYPCPIAVDMEPLSNLTVPGCPPEYLLLPPRSAVLEAPASLTADLQSAPTRHPTRQGIETYVSDRNRTEAIVAIDGRASGESFSAIHFQGCSLRQDELLHTP